MFGRKFERTDGDYYSPIYNGLTNKWQIGEFTEHPIYGSDYLYRKHEFMVNTIDLAERICEAMLEAFEDGANSTY